MNKLLPECLIGGYITDFKLVSLKHNTHATFHTWGLTVLEGKPIVVGIVESAGGKCLYVPTDKIEFIDNTIFVTGQRINVNLANK
ncbi:MAG: hypothetical protein JWQ63_1975 [Mucilaginibacter sp.]|nr:hypothetical protein [Mucilaginibacter sp.]